MSRIDKAAVVDMRKNAKTFAYLGILGKKFDNHAAGLANPTLIRNGEL